MRIVWATDIHFDMAEPAAIQRFFREAKAAAPDAFLLAGDISMASDADMTVDWIANELDCPLFFVLGNHDYYGGSIGTVRQRMRALTVRSETVKWLPAVPGVVALGPTALVGHDGWYDGGCGDPLSTLRLRDFDEIDDLVGLHREARERLTRWLAEDGASQLAGQLAGSTASSVLVVTHVPPFQDASRCRGERSSNEALPFYCNTALGRVLTDFALDRPAVDVRVLCGHTHDRYDVDILPNLHISVGGAEYGSPAVAGVLEIG